MATNLIRGFKVKSHRHFRRTLKQVPLEDTPKRYQYKDIPNYDFEQCHNDGKHLKGKVKHG